MKVGIIGLGYVGSAVAHSHRNHTLIIRDPKLGNDSASLNSVLSCNVIYVCVPTPMLEDGHCDDSYVKSVLNELTDYTGLIICKSTVPPGVYLRLHDRYPNLVHAPEFLTAANATADYESASWVLLGGSIETCQKAQDVISSSTISATHYHYTDIATASLFKYIANSFLATKVTFMNDMYHLAKEVGVDWNELKKVGYNDPRLGLSHWDVPGPDGQFGFGGACFPKDVSAICEHALDMGLHLKLLESVKEINSLHRS